MDQYLPVLLLVLFAAGFAVGGFALNRALAPGGRLNPAKLGPYESGIAPRREPAHRFPVRFYLVAMIFIIFDIEVVFLYPFAVMFKQLSLFGWVEMGSFALVVFIAFAYLVSEGALDWGPGKRVGTRTGSPNVRTTYSTIRRVGRPGVQPDSRLTSSQGPFPQSREPEGAAAASWVPAPSSARPGPTSTGSD
ncbi:MAG TPA: NADH-quinone oxidoreductase subunit A [Acidimicrobiales bacterium]|nr:NADH-quinone oxidoreductase subunit A [Acidimicrobiales bacterium]